MPTAISPFDIDDGKGDEGRIVCRIPYSEHGEADARLIENAPEMRLQLMYDRGLIQALAAECEVPMDDVLENIDALLRRIEGEEAPK